jgi:hypothetical protein
MARSSECTEQYAQKVFDSAGIVREAIFRQLPQHCATMIGMPSALAFSVLGFSVGVGLIALSGILVISWRHSKGRRERRIMIVLLVLLFFPVGFMITAVGWQYTLWNPGAFIATRLAPASGRMAVSFFVNATCFYGIILALDALATRFRQTAS